jgi:hypothetical protein
LPCLFQFVSFITILSSFHFLHRLPPIRRGCSGLAPPLVVGPVCCLHDF